MKFSQYLLEEKATEEFSNFITELFGDSEASLSRKMAANNLLKDKKNAEAFVTIFAEPLTADILKILKKLPDNQRRKGAYLAYMLLQKQGKDSKWFKMFKTTNQSMLTHKDEEIKKGANLAKVHIEGNRPEVK